MHDGRVVLHQNDCRDVLRGLADNSIDSVVTDPPYALVSIQKRFGKPGSAPAKDVYGRGAAGFMGKQWDTGEVAFSDEFWAEVLRVLKPGGHVVAFSGTRTYHRMAVAIEDAGFEIRDQLGWVYGSGFPKSHDVSKGIAKRRVEDVEPVRIVCRFIRAAMDESGLKSKDLTQHFGDCNPRLIDHWAARDTDSQPALPTNEQWDGLVDALSLSGRDGFEFISIEVSRLNGRKGTHGERWAEAEIIGEVASTPAGFGDLRFEGDRTIRSLDEEAAAWQGWGTALKPAWEPICLARKPLMGTVAENVLEHGTGAINIDGSRVPGGNEHELGRWPANILHDGSEEVLAAFPDAKGQQGDLNGQSKDRKSNGIYGDMPPAARQALARVESETSAARFFYCAKASRSDRDAGLEHLPKKAGGMVSNTSGQHMTRRDEGYKPEPRANTHPTVKPTTLMQWLCRLITPPGGVVLDPFMGSGSTGKAAVLEGFQFVGCEREDEYMPIATARIAWAIGASQKDVVASAAVPANDNRPADLFSEAA
nr:DNA methyltransferase [Agrobacterium tumefaciens]